ncbi:MAG: hypothetical protein GWN58_29775 [Anaerolineae bacterium]|nr:hypothetical protein [Anaerolineae bacterium]
MQIIVNETRIARGARIGKIGTFAGLGFLVVGLIASLSLQTTSLIWVSFACLLLGILVSSIGTMNMNRWVREPRADQALAQGLKGFDDRYRLYSYYLPAPHVLLGPSGLFVLTTMGQDGTIHYDGTKFRRDFSALRLLRFMAEEGLGKPFSEADSQVAAMQKLLDKEEAGEGVEIQNVVVFYNPRAQLSVSDPPRPVVTRKALKKAIRRQQADGGTKLSGNQYRELRDLFDEAVG